ncbi:MAG: hypothetical protein K6B74_13390 [Ruminococcus sp.]|nr:hypothetical protein [Ruminococcus sp.]
MVWSVHNLRLMLRKDPGAHFTYNIGVSFLRAGVFLLGAAAVIFCCSLINTGNRLEYTGDCEVIIKGIWRKNTNPIPIFSSIFPSVSYYVYVQLRDPDRLPDYSYDTDEKYDMYGDYNAYGEYEEYDRYDGFGDIKIFISKESFEKILDFGVENHGLIMHDYRTETSGSYISFLEKEAAEKEYARVNPRNGLRYTSLFVLLIALPVLWIGKREEELGMKYPRSDVPVELSGALVPMEEVGSFPGTEVDEAEDESALLLTDGENTAADETSAP